MSHEDDVPRERPARLSRRTLIKRAGVIGAVATVPVGALAPHAEAKEELEPLKALTAGEAATLGAALDRLLPSDATGPGATEANVLRYVDWALAGERSMFRDAYASGIAALDAYAQGKFGAAFASLTTAQQDAVLTDLDTNTATGFAPNAKAVFEMFRTHAVEGMFGDPAHGGNTGFVGWKLVRFPGPRLIIPAADQQINANPKQALQSTYSLPLFKGQQKGAE
jgi:gluconate 2-dehydrogenase gamma chain